MTMAHITVAEDNGGGLVILDWTRHAAWDVREAGDGLGIQDMMAAGRGDTSDWTVPEIACNLESREIVADLSDGDERPILTLYIGAMGVAARAYFGIPRE